MNSQESIDNGERPIVGYRPLADFLTDQGFPFSHSTAMKYGALGVGPPKEGYWGKFPIFLPSRALAWAQERSKAPSRSRPHKQPEQATAAQVTAAA